MDIAIIVVLVLNILAVASGAYLTWHIPGQLQGWVLDAISEAIRKQDDRIQKRVQRMEGQDADSSQTRADRNDRGEVGRPFRR